LSPKVTFVVPCYKLGHLLPECVNSILSQTYADFEILIMDDCSPDNTPQVAASFSDPRVRYIRHAINLGHLHNYNKGITLARGEYVWLISADDRLRRPNILERYVDVMDKHPEAGYACCPAVEMTAGKETDVAEYSVLGTHDLLFKGSEFFQKLISRNFVIAASGMVRKSCYEKFGAFPLDLPYAGDWYLWCLFARHSDVAYFADPMVNYRQHAQSMSNILTRKEHAKDNTEISWRIAHLAREIGCRTLVKKSLKSVADYYARYLFSARSCSASDSMCAVELEELIRQHALDGREARAVRAGVYSGLGNDYYYHQEFAQAIRHYGMALDVNPWMPKVWVKSVLLRMGRIGRYFRDSGKRYMQSVE
jgi:glycosyltransferase involved in cell wall biosynthesis